MRKNLMNFKEFLQWVYNRLKYVYSNPTHHEHMLRLDRFIGRMDQQETCVDCENYYVVREEIKCKDKESLREPREDRLRSTCMGWTAKKHETCGTCGYNFTDMENQIDLETIFCSSKYPGYKNISEPACKYWTKREAEPEKPGHQPRCYKIAGFRVIFIVNAFHWRWKPRFEVKYDHYLKWLCFTIRVEAEYGY